MLTPTQWAAQNKITLPKTPPPSGGVGGFISGIGGNISNAFKGGVNEVKQGYNEAKNAQNPVQLLSGGIKEASGVASALTSPLASVLTPTLGAGTNYISKKISNIPAVQKFAMSKTGQNVAKGTQTVEDLSNITGTIEGGMQLGDVASKLYGKLSTPSEVSPPTPEEQAITEAKTEAQTKNNQVSEAQKEVQQAKAEADIAAEERKNATPKAVKGVQDINTKVGEYKTSLGEQFASDAEKIKTKNPNLKSNLTNEQVNVLNGLKESKNFTLPKNLEVDDTLPDYSKMNPKVAAQLKGKLGAIGAEPNTALDPVEAQNLIKELNRSTYKQMPDGTFQIDQQRIGITNELKAQFSKDFGKSWDDIYSHYSEGRAAIDKIDNLINLDPKANPEEINSQLQGILKLSKTPEGKLLLQQSIDEYAKTSGIDLNDPIKAIQQIADKETAIADKETALDKANKNLSETQKEAMKAQRAVEKAQRDADIARIKQEEKEKTFSGRHPAVKEWGKYIAKRAVAGGLIYATLYPTIRAIQAALAPKK